MRFLTLFFARLCGVLFHPELWTLVIVLIRRFIHPHLERARGRASLWHVPNVPLSVVVHGRITILAPNRLRMGEHVRIGAGCFFHCLGGLTIGENTQISRDVLIYTANHDELGNAVPYDTEYKLRAVVIGRSVWIGMRVSITPGVTIGDGAIIGLGTVVSRDVPPGAVVVGSPQRVIRFRDMDRFRDLDNRQQWFGRIFPDH